MIIPVRNLLAEQESTPKTYLMNTEVAGTTIFRLRNTNAFKANWAIQIGETGEEQTEILVLTSNDPGAGTLGTTSAASRFEHPADTPVYGIKYNQVVFEVSTAGTTGVATPLTDGTVTYQADHLVTIFDDTAGSSAYGYRTLFRNSALSVNTTESDWITTAGFSFYSLGKIRERTKAKLWNSDFLDDIVVDDWTNEFKDKLTNAAIQANEDYALGTVGVGFGTDGLGTVTTGDFKQPRRVWITYNGVDSAQSTKMDTSDDYPNRQYTSVHPYHNWMGNDIIKINPAENGGTANITFYRMGTPMVNDTDELPRFMRGYTDGFVDYNLIQAQYKDQKISLTEKKGAETTLIREFVGQLAPRDKSGPTYITVTEAISAEDGL